MGWQQEHNNQLHTSSHRHRLCCSGLTAIYEPANVVAGGQVCGYHRGYDQGAAYDFMGLGVGLLGKLEAVLFAHE